MALCLPNEIWDRIFCIADVKEFVKHYRSYMSVATQKKILRKTSIFKEASKGDLEMIKILYQLGFKPFNAITVAASKGHLHVVKWLYNKSPENIIRAISYAAANGQLCTLKWLINKYEYVTRDTYIPRYANSLLHIKTAAMEIAAKFGHLEIIKYLCGDFERLCPKHVIINAIFYEHLHIVHWLHSNSNESQLKELKKYIRMFGYYHAYDLI